MEDTVLDALRAGRLAGARVSKEQTDSSWAIYRVEDDLQLNTYASLLREHVLLTTEDQAPVDDDGFRELLDSWSYRCGVASVSMLSSTALPESIVAFAGTRAVSVCPWIGKGGLEQRTLRFPWDQAGRYLQSAQAAMAQSFEARSDGILGTEAAALSFVVEFYCAEEPVAEYELGEEGCRDSQDRGNVHTSEGEYTVQNTSTGEKRRTDYSFWRLGVLERYTRATLLESNLRVLTERSSQWPVPALLATMSTIRAYCRELLYGTQLREAARQLNDCFGDLRSEASLAVVTKTLPEAFLLDACRAVELLGRFRASGALPSLGRMLASSEKELRLSVVRAISRLREPARGEHLHRALSDTNERVRRAAISGLAAMHDDFSVRVLWDYFPRSNAEEKACILRGLGSSKSIRAFELLLECVVSDSAQLACAASWPIRHFLEHQEMTTCAQRWFQGLAPERREVIIAALGRTSRATNEDSVSACIDIMAALGDRAAVPFLADILTEARGDTGGFEAAKALGEIGGDEACEALLQTLDGRGTEVPWSLVEALGKLQVKRSLPGLIALLNEGKWTREVIRTLGLLGDQSAVEPIRKAMAQHDYVADEACEALQRLGVEHEVDRRLDESPKRKMYSARDRCVTVRYPGGTRSTFHAWSS